MNNIYINAAELLMERIRYCSLCGAQDSHDVCEVQWTVLKEWIASVEERLAQCQRVL